MNTILAALRFIAFGATVAVAGVQVTRSTLAGFDVGDACGLTAVEVVQAIDAMIVDAPLPVPVARASRPTVPSTSGREALYSRTINAVKPLRGLTVTIRSAPLAGGYPRLALSCSAGRGCSRDEHVMAARTVVAALRGEGLNAAAEGSTVYVLAA